jgi:hypothetical protein
VSLLATIDQQSFLNKRGRTFGGSVRVGEGIGFEREGCDRRSVTDPSVGALDK